MKYSEFKNEYDKLVSVYPTTFENEFKEKAIAAYVLDLDPKWWAALVNRMILSSNPRLDIDDAARGERLAKQRYHATKELLEAQETFSNNSTKAGLDNYLKSMGAKSLLEAIEIKKEGK